MSKRIKGIILDCCNAFVSKDAMPQIAEDMGFWTVFHCKLCGEVHHEDSVQYVYETEEDNND